MKRCQEFYKSVFEWEFSNPPGMQASQSADKPSAPTYVMFSKPGTKLSGGVILVKEEDMIRPKLDADGRGQTTNRITMRVEEVDAALKSIEAAGGTIIW